MRWLALTPLVLSLGCSLFAGGVTGAWSSSNGLEVEIQQDRSWKGSVPIGLGRLEFSGQWNLDQDTLTLVPSRWSTRSNFPGMRVSGGDQEAMNRDARMAVEMIRSKSFRLSKDGEYDVLLDTSQNNDQTMYRVE
jgi:hypothetical protein